MQRLNENYASINQMAGKLFRNHSTKTEDSQSAELSFEQVLKTTKENSTEGLRFSKHANERLATRNINLSAEQITRLENGTTKAREKGIQESLVMVDNMAFIVNVKNNTVVTAIGDSADSIFTNIDGAVIS